MRNIPMSKKIFIFLVLLSLVYAACEKRSSETDTTESGKLRNFLITKSELDLRYRHAPAERRLSFRNVSLAPEKWKVLVKEKLAEIL